MSKTLLPAILGWRAEVVAETKTFVPGGASMVSRTHTALGVMAGE
jgi:hypothetical protein